MIYQSIYDIICQYIYGAPDIVMTQFQELVATEVATTFSLICLFLPFGAALLVTKWVFGK